MNRKDNIFNDLAAKPVLGILTEIFAICIYLGIAAFISYLITVFVK